MDSNYRLRNCIIHIYDDDLFQKLCSYSFGKIIKIKFFERLKFHLAAILLLFILMKINISVLLNVTFDFRFFFEAIS